MNGLLFFCFSWLTRPFNQVTVGIFNLPRHQSTQLRTDGIDSMESHFLRLARLKRLPAIKRQVCFHVFYITISHRGGLTETAHSLGVFTAVQVALALSPTQNFPGASHFKSFGDGFSCFCFTCCTGHNGAILNAKGMNATSFR